MFSLILADPEVTAIQEVVRDSTTSFNITLVFGTQLAPQYRLSWRSQDGQYAGNATFANNNGHSALQLTVSDLAPGQTYDVSIEALGNDGVRSGLDRTITLGKLSSAYKSKSRELIIYRAAVFI